MSLPSGGEFRVARAEDMVPRTVFVVKRDYSGRPVCQVMLVTHEVELKTAYDVLLHASETGLPIPVAVETDMCISILDSQLDEEPIGCLAEIPDYLSVLLPDRSTLPSNRVGLPLEGASDQRWRWKEGELEHLLLLQRPLFELVVGD